MLPSILDYYIDDDGDSNFLIKVCPNHTYPNYLCNNAGVLNLPTALPMSTKNNNRHEYNKLYREMIILHKCFLMLKIDLLKFQLMHCSDVHVLIGAMNHPEYTIKVVHYLCHKSSNLNMNLDLPTETPTSKL